jgi:hypothetical protein
LDVVEGGEQATQVLSGADGRINSPDAPVVAGVK